MGELLDGYVDTVYVDKVLESLFGRVIRSRFCVCKWSPGYFILVTYAMYLKAGRVKHENFAIIYFCECGLPSELA